MQDPLTSKPTKTGVARLIAAARYSWQGLSTAWRNEEAFRLEGLLAILLIPTAIWLGDNGVERALLIGVTLLVMIVELLNSAIEAVVDRISQELHPLSKAAKDTGSAAVLVAMVLWLAVWGCVLLPHWITP